MPLPRHCNDSHATASYSHKARHRIEYDIEARLAVTHKAIGQPTPVVRAALKPIQAGRDSVIGHVMAFGTDAEHE